MTSVGGSRARARVLRLLLYIIFSASLFALALLLASPPKLVVITTLSGGVHTIELPRLYTLSEAMLIVCLSCTATVSAVLILAFPSGVETRGGTTALESQTQAIDINSMLRGLDENEKSIVEALLKNGGSMYQSDLARELNMPKSTLSTILRRLEQKKVIIRVNKGFKNLVILKHQPQDK